METERSRNTIFGTKVYENLSPTPRAFRVERNEMNDFEIMLAVVFMAMLLDLAFWG